MRSVVLSGGVVAPGGTSKHRKRIERIMVLLLDEAAHIEAELRPISPL